MAAFACRLETPGTPSFPSAAALFPALLLVLVACDDDSSKAPAEQGTTDDAYEGDDDGECTDRVDHDRNGLFDCDDPGCAGSPDCDSAGEGEGEGEGEDEADSDGDGYLDIWELEECTDPNDPESRIYTGGWPYNPDKDADSADAPSSFDWTVGSPLVRFVLLDQHGEEVDIYDYHNDSVPLMLDVSASWCGPCGSIAEWIAGMVPADTYVPYARLPERVQSGELHWITLLVESDRGVETSAADLAQWDTEYPNEAVPVLGGPGVFEVGYSAVGVGWPTFHLFSPELLLEVSSTSDDVSAPLLEASL